MYANFEAPHYTNLDKHFRPSSHDIYSLISKYVNVIDTTFHCRRHDSASDSFCHLLTRISTKRKRVSSLIAKRRKGGVFK
jgi:hypothetical protein